MDTFVIAMALTGLGFGMIVMETILNDHTFFPVFIFGIALIFHVIKLST